MPILPRKTVSFDQRLVTMWLILFHWVLRYLEIVYQKQGFDPQFSCKCPSTNGNQSTLEANVVPHAHMQQGQRNFWIKRHCMYDIDAEQIHYYNHPNHPPSLRQGVFPGGLWFIFAKGLDRAFIRCLNHENLSGPTINQLHFDQSLDIWAMKKPWLVRVFRGLYYPAIWGLLKKHYKDLY